ncbi:MAG: dTMP kinase [Gammaproteobacteria bacterium CG22_combo_CG10-13_8_21_14_all_40_8]|nr:MAG: dTMP kinase [Gammaproteobacteria bacterium CG22_combo_CG10-13_8_21_14_all_40_8]
MKHGLFITIEGVEGAGKSTVIAAITELLTDLGLQHITTREPGGTPFSEEIRAILLNNRDETVEPLTELLLMNAARVQHVKQLIKPSLHNGIHVICDRFNDSTFAYQGGGRELDMHLLETLDQLTLEGFKPDLTLLLDLDVNIGLQRAAKRGEKDRFEQEKYDFFNKVRQCFLQRAQAVPERYQIIDASQSENQVKQAVIHAVRECLAKKRSMQVIAIERGNVHE